ncbi:MAG: hypothetical protein C0190_06305 [Thermodesulfobacterium geofontis]|uniref:diguanylate cyclase n=1 Tax=Thermodesulfobacterium geofontis TaxID=1295609 RepID=A0A2N7PM49_9BACT|nr:MAG: hypothetical protein C0190_06305 [Thermodesulfobacterium geofontis]
MSLKKFFSLFFIFIFSFLLISYIFIYKFLEFGFLSLKKEEAKKVISKVEFYFQKELDKLHNLTKDWAAWDEAYLFMQNKQPYFIKSNIIPETYLNLKIDLLLYTYLNGGIKAGGLFNKENKKIYINKEILHLVKSTLEKFSKKNQYNYKKLIIFINKPFILAVYPVLRSDFTGVPKGYLFMGKFLTSEELDTVANLFNIKELKILKSDKPSPEINFIKVDLKEVILEKTWFLNDQALKLRMGYIVVGESLIRSFIFYVVITQISLLLIFAIMVSFLIDKHILKPLLKLLKEIDQVKNKEKTRLSLEYNTKEYENLAKVINKFLEDISIRENIYKTVAEKTENLIILFDKERNIIFQNTNTKIYFNSEELKSFINKFLEEAKGLNFSEGKLKINEISFKNYWFNFQVIKVFKDLYLLIGQNITELKLKEDALFRMATHDFLTDLYNRRYLEDVLQRIAAASKRGEKFVLLFIDCNDLKKINDLYGHLVGDEVLKSVAKAIKENIRKEDLASRWGGDEFVVILNHCDKNTGIKIAERIISNLESSEIKTDFAKIKPSVSIGLVEIDETKEINEILNLADKLSYKSKETGKIEYD